MCYKVACSSCSKPTWAGCGMHVTSALAGVKEEDRCPNWKGGSKVPCDNGKPTPQGQEAGSANCSIN